MSVKEQWNVVKQNWLLVLIGLVVIVLVTGFFQSVFSIQGPSISGSSLAYDRGYAEDAASSFYPGGSIAPEVEDRIITYYANINSEVRGNKFDETIVEVKQIVDDNSVIITNENLGETRYENDGIKNAYYSFRVPVENYDSFVESLRNVGKVKDFSESSDDITGQYQSLEIELDAERERLERYKDLLAKSNNVQDQLQLTDRIYDQERRIGYLEEAVNNQDERVDYASVSFTLREKESKFSGISLISFAGIIGALVASVNGLITLVSWILPWVVLVWIIWFIVKKFKKK